MKSNEADDQYSPEETARRRDEATRRALNRGDTLTQSRALALGEREIARHLLALVAMPALVLIGINRSASTAVVDGAGLAGAAGFIF